MRANRVNTDVFGVAMPTFYYDLKKENALLRYDSPEVQVL